MELTNEQERKIQLIYNLGADGIAIAPNLVLEDTLRKVVKKRNGRLAIKPFFDEFKNDLFTLEDPMSKETFERIDGIRQQHDLRKPDSILTGLGKAFGIGFLLFGVFGSLVAVTSMWALGQIAGWWFLLSGGLLMFYLFIMRFVKLPRTEYNTSKSGKYYMSHIALINPHSELFNVSEADFEKYTNFILEK